MRLPLPRIAALAILLLAPALAQAQSTLQQAGPWTGGHVPMYVGPNGQMQTIVQDSGGASGGGNGLGLSELNITARGTGAAPYASQGTGPYNSVFSIFDGPATSPAGYHYMTFSANAQGGGLIAYGAAGAASTLPLQFIVNGSTYQFPFVTGGIVGPSTSVVGDAACWNNTTGTLLADCGAFVTVGGNNTWTGTNNFTGPFKISGVTETFPPSGSIVGTSDTQTLTNKSINASEVNSGTLSGAVMPAFTGDVTNPAGSLATTISAGVVTNAKLAVMTQNAVKGAATSTAVADLAVPSCSGGGNALQWTTNTGFSCATLSSQTAGWGLTQTGSVFSISTTAPPFPYDFPVNMGLSASAAGSALTINLTTANGSTPSATNPVLVPFRSTTITTGTTVWASITSALSITIPSAATLGTTNTVPFRIWVFLEYNAGVPELVVATCSTPGLIYNCSSWESGVTTTTTINGFATAAGTPYATAGVSNDAIRMIGYASYASGLTTAGAWASTPTSLHVMGPGHKKPGDVVQTVTNSTTTVGSTTSTTFVALTNGQSQAITPSSSVNLVRVFTLGTLSSATGQPTLQVQRGTTLIGNPIAENAATNTTVPASILVYDQPGVATATTYSYQGKITSGTLNYPATSTGAILELQEIMGALPDPANDNVNPGAFSLTG